jgi:threonyl-tRNA synthetase
MSQCRLQIVSEIEALFDFMQHIYGMFGFEFRMELSTRPDNYLGTIETWDVAEAVSPFVPLLGMITC